MTKQKQSLAAGYTIVIASVMVALLSVASVGILNMTKYSEHLGDAGASAFSDEVILKQAIRTLSSTKLGNIELQKCPETFLFDDNGDSWWVRNDNCSNPFIGVGQKNCEVYYVNPSFQHSSWREKPCRTLTQPAVQNLNIDTVKFLTGVRTLLEHAQIKNAPITCDASNNNGELVYLSERTIEEISYIHVEASVQPNTNLRFSSDPDYYAWVVANRVREGERCPSGMLNSYEHQRFLRCDTYQVRVCIKRESGEKILFHDTQIQVAKWGRVRPIPKPNK